MSFNAQFDQDAAWRQEFAGRLKLLARWLQKQGLVTAAVEEGLQRLEAQAHSGNETPKSRHALLTIAQPLLKQGPGVLDTPVLHATGTEPEATAGRVAQADAAVFALPADTGITLSGLAIRPTHVGPGGRVGEGGPIRRAAVIAGIGELEREAGRILHTRHRDLAEQILELRGLRGESSGVASRLHNRIAQEQAEFARSSARIQAVRSVQQALLARAVDMLGVPALKADLAELRDALKQPGIKLRLKKTYGQTFVQLRERLHTGQALAAEIQTMLAAAFEQLNAEFGFSLQAAQAPDLARPVHDLDLVERSHLQYLGLGNLVRLAQADFSDRLVGTLGSRLRVVFEVALGEVELWGQSAAAQLDAQVREQHQISARRLEALKRIAHTASSLDARIAELDQQQALQKVIAAKLADLTARLLEFHSLPGAANQPRDPSAIRAAMAAAA